MICDKGWVILLLNLLVRSLVASFVFQIRCKKIYPVEVKVEQHTGQSHICWYLHIWVEDHRKIGKFWLKILVLWKSIDRSLNKKQESYKKISIEIIWICLLSFFIVPFFTINGESRFMGVIDICDIWPRAGATIKKAGESVSK